MQMVGDKKLCYSKEFIIPSGEKVEISYKIDGWDVKLTLCFEKSEVDSSDNRVTVVPKDGHAVITFMNWESPLGTCTSRSVKLGTHGNGKDIFFAAAAYLIGKTHKLTFQLLLGGTSAG